MFAKRLGVPVCTLILALSGVTPALAGVPLGGEPDVVTKTTSDDLPPITREEIIIRARSWLDPPVPYSQAANHTNDYGTYRTDCSGYLSMTWDLPEHGTNTVGLRELSEPITGAELRQGDILLDADGTNTSRHVVLFDRWANAEKTRYVGYEQGTSGTVLREIPYPYFSAMSDFHPYRRPNIADIPGTGA
ncbi:MAG: hypothetical protein M3548_24175 [Actinomycetota bacterium]|nr:hypothetical protein [Actinomycetota bacterium]